MHDVGVPLFYCATFFFLGGGYDSGIHLGKPAN